MSRARSLVFSSVAVVLGIGCVVACADAPSPDPNAFGDGEDAPTRDGGSSGSSGSSKLPPSSSSSSSASPPSDGGPPVKPAPADAGPSSVDGGSKTDAGTIDAGSSNGSCNATNACASATIVGQLRGDEGNDFQNISGSGSTFVRVRVVEADTGLFAVPMKLTARLTSPAGSNYDVFIYVANDDTQVPTCSPIISSSTTSNAEDACAVTWGENGTFFDNVLDDRWATVEVRHVSGGCGTWSLQLIGGA